MATILEQEEQINLGEGEEIGNLDELVAAQAEPVAEAKDTIEKADELEDELNVPEKFRGKSKKEIIESYKEAERELGRKANEIGELRKLADEIIKKNLELNVGGTPAKKKIEVDDILEDPEKALEYAVANSPEVKQIKEALLRKEREEEHSRFEDKHPDYREVIADQNFQKWVGESPVRLKMFTDADKNYDYLTATELLDIYKQVNGNVAQKQKESQEAQKAKREEALKAATTEKGGTGQSTKKIYSRQALMKMIQTNRDAYNDPAFQAELAKAYKEGRVR